MVTPKNLRRVFYVELLVNLASILAFMFGGAAILEQFGVAVVTPPLVEAFQWFATLLIVITYILARALFSQNDRALRYVLEGYLIGDLVYLVVLFRFVGAIGGVWTFGSVFGLAFTVFIATMRVLYLWQTRGRRNGK